MTLRRRTVAAITSTLAAFGFLLAWSTHAQETFRWTDVQRVVVVGDVHGAYEALVEVLQVTGIVGPNLGWTGGGTHLVSLGDLLDRGAEARRVMDLLMRLQLEAAAAGGHVHVVLGNHELMNLLGDLRYVAPSDFAAFAAEETAAMRAAAYGGFVAETRGDPRATQAEFDRTYPPGYFARQAAFAPSGRYGAWLLSLPAIVVIDDTAYVHGGLPPLVADLALDLNARLQRQLWRYLELRDELARLRLLAAVDRGRDVDAARTALPTAPPEVALSLQEFIALADAVEFGIEGPLWYRGSVYCKPLLEEATLDAALERLAVTRVIVGHTPTVDHRVRELYGGKLVMADTGMLAEYFHGQPTALVLEDAALAVQYLRPEALTRVESSGMLVAYGRTEAELRDALSRGAVTAIERTDDIAPWRVLLDYDDTRFAATFRPNSGDRANDYELAAAALDELLGTTLVAPTVPRDIDGQAGTLQLQYPDAVTEAERVARGLGFSGWCPIEPQLRLMYAFDLLLGNRGRTTHNVVFNNDLTDLTVTEHTQAFGTERTLPAGFDPAKFEIPPSLLTALRALDEPRLRAAVGTWIDSRRIRALLARRDRLVQD